MDGYYWLRGRGGWTPVRLRSLSDNKVEVSWIGNDYIVEYTLGGDGRLYSDYSGYYHDVGPHIEPPTT